MLIEAILAATGAISRPGSIENGTTVCDFEDVERRVGRSVSLAVASTVVGQRPQLPDAVLPAPVEPTIAVGRRPRPVRINLRRHPRARRLRR